MSLKKKLIFSFLIMLTVPAVLIILLSALLVGVYTIINPAAELPVFGGDALANPFLIKFVIIWAFIALLAIIVTGICVFVYFVKSLFTPLKNLSVAMEHMKNGDLSYELIGSEDSEISELCNSCEELRRRLQRNVQSSLKKENEQKMLLANISHDIKTPITSIKGYVEGIRDGVADTPEKQRHYLDTIYTKAEAIEQMAENLSVYSKLELGKLQYNRERVDINAFLSAAIGEHSLDLQCADMRLVTDIAQETAYCLLDKEKLRRVISNIITNSIKYKLPGEGIFTAKSEITENGILITLSDNGRGIDEKDIPHIFDGFYRGDKSRTSAVEGNGLGLSISKRIINDHGGKIWVRNGESRGCDIIILLPIIKQEGGI